MATVAILIPTMGERSSLGYTLASSQAMLSHCDIFVVCKTDLMNMPLGIRTLREPSHIRGPYAAITWAVATLPEQYKWFTWINDDDALLPGFRSCVNVALGSARQPAVVYGAVEYISEKGCALGDAVIAQNRWELSFAMRARSIAFTQQGVLIRRDVFGLVNGFDDSLKLSADTDLFFRLWKRGEEFTYVHSKVAQYRIHAEQLSQDEQARRLEERRHLTNSRAVAVSRKLWRCWSFVRNIDKIVARRRLTGRWTVRALLADAHLGKQ